MTLLSEKLRQEEFGVRLILVEDFTPRPSKYGVTRTFSEAAKTTGYLIGWFEAQDYHTFVLVPSNIWKRQTGTWKAPGSNEHARDAARLAKWGYDFIRSLR